MAVATRSRFCRLSRLLQSGCGSDAITMKPADLVGKTLSKSMSTLTFETVWQSAPASSNVRYAISRTISSSPTSSQTAAVQDDPVDGSGKAELISKAMRAYIDRARTHGKFMDKQCAEFDIGKRHLARIMGKDPELDFTQGDVDKAIEYLFPSGLFAPPARPFMRHPSKVYPKRKAPQFGWDGRPFHPFYYTGRPQFNRVLHDGRINLEKVTEAEAVAKEAAKEAAKDKSKKPWLMKSREDDAESQSDESAAERMSVYLSSTKWIAKEHFAARLIEKVNDRDYDRFVNLGERIIEHTSSSHLAKDFLVEYREPIGDLVRQREIREPLVDEETGVRYSIGTGGKKCSKAEVILREGSGKVVINGHPDGVDFFGSFYERVQILTPFAFLGRVDDFDIEAEVKGPSNSFLSSAGAIRIAICRALTAFCTPTEVENMRLAGLLTEDPRKRERKLPGQKGARAKFRWNRR